MAETHPLIVRITAGSKPSKDVTESQAHKFNGKFWEALMRFFPQTEDPTRVRILWQPADARSTSVWDVLIEVMGAQPTDDSVGEHLKQAARDLLPLGYETVVVFPIHPVLSPVS